MNMRITLISFFISITCHAFALTFPGLFGANVREVPENIKLEIRVHSILPKVQNIDTENKLKETEQETRSVENIYKISKTVDKKRNKEEKKDKPKENSTDNDIPGETIIKKGDACDDLLRYQDAIKQRIQQERKYPVWAEKHGIEGQVGIRFIVRKNGSIGGIYVISPSGCIVLDNEAVETVKRSAPFPKIPSHMNMSRIEVDVTLVFIQ